MGLNPGLNLYISVVVTWVYMRVRMRAEFNQLHLATDIIRITQIVTSDDDVIDDVTSQYIYIYTYRLYVAICMCLYIIHFRINV